MGTHITPSTISKYQIVSCPDRGVTLKFEVRSDYAQRKYSTNRGSYREKPCGVEKSRGILVVRTVSYHTVLCGVCRVYCIISLMVRIVSYRTVLLEEIQYEPWIVCTVRDLPYMCVLYCRPIARISYRVVSYPTVRRVVPYQYSIQLYHDFLRAVLYETYGMICG
jgi:hypothetical protein